MLDDPTDMVGTALLYLGKDPNSESEADLKAAEEALMKIRPFLRTIHSSQYIEQLANGELCIVVGYSGDVLQARDRAEEAGKPLDIGYSIPQEGALMWFDTLAIPADAAHKDAAHQFIEYLLQPEVAAKNSDFVNFANANEAATRARQRRTCATTPTSTRHLRSPRDCSRAWRSPPSTRVRSTAPGHAS